MPKRCVLWGMAVEDEHGDPIMDELIPQLPLSREQRPGLGQGLPGTARLPRRACQGGSASRHHERLLPDSVHPYPDVPRTGHQAVRRP